MLGKLIKKALNILQYIKLLMLYFIGKLLFVFVKNKPSYKNLWLIAERSTDARDNGYHFFKYLCLDHKEINCAYVIGKSSPDYGKIIKLGRAIEPGTLGHYIAFACSKVKISTHIMGYAPDPYRFAMMERKRKIVGGKKVFLQHGVTYNYVPELRNDKVNLDLFVCCTIPEYGSLTKNYGYPDGVIRRIGFCRYDALLEEHEVKKQILVMPTWRYHLRELSDEEFKKSEYYECFNGLISDERVHKMLEENDFELVLYLHYELQKFSGLFCGNSERVKVRVMGDADVQRLLMESAMLITDYSSIFFDFAYMKKPLCYWTFDSERFFSEQYGKGYFNYGEDGFGPEIKDKDGVISFMEHEFKNGMTVDEKYTERTERTFESFTNDHCKKTYEAILDLLG